MKVWQGTDLEEGQEERASGSKDGGEGKRRRVGKEQGQSCRTGGTGQSLLGQFCPNKVCGNLEGQEGRQEKGKWVTIHRGALRLSNKVGSMDAELIAWEMLLRAVTQVSNPVGEWGKSCFSLSLGGLIKEIDRTNCETLCLVSRTK